MAPRLDKFRGYWRMERWIEDRRAGHTGALQGEARFSDDAAGLVYEEEGVLRFPGQPDVTARQTYFWRQSARGIEVFFSDGRPFHDLAADATLPCPQHHCPPDDYAGRFDFSTWPEWQVEWHVSGPRKDYSTLTRYGR